MYAYQSTMLCDECAYDVIDQLEEKGIEDEGDTETYPQSASSTESSDTPEHCGDCGEFLENDLTDTGREYVAHTIRRHCEDGSGTEQVVMEWASYYSGWGLKWESVPLALAVKIANLISTEIKAVRYMTSYGELRDLPYYEYWDLGSGKPFLFADETGPLRLVVASSDCDAHSIHIDECDTIPPDEVHEAYGAFDNLHKWMLADGHEDTPHLRDFCTRYAALWLDLSIKAHGYDDWDLIEGYEYQSNSSGTGIVSVSDNLQIVDPKPYGIVVDLVSE